MSPTNFIKVMIKHSKKFINLLLFLLLFCNSDYKLERKKWAEQYRNQILKDFNGFLSKEDLFKNFIKNLNKIKEAQFYDYVLTDEEYLRLIWANEDWDRIYDPGSTLENIKMLRNINLKKRFITIQNYFKNKNIEFIDFEIENEIEHGKSKIYFIKNLKIKENNQIKNYKLIKSIIEHNQQYKIIVFDEFEN